MKISDQKEKNPYPW